ncbi:MAG: hypothetical protein NZM33_16640 [Bryobacteraceae bacterium]|nr:hypothetical protein [Bryobacteraceae bacterium]
MNRLKRVAILTAAAFHSSFGYSAPLLNSSITNYSFPSVQLGSPPNHVDIKLSASARGVAITSIDLVGDVRHFHVELPQMFPQPVSPLAPYILRVSYRPKSTGKHNATLRLYYSYNDDGRWPMDIRFTGEAKCSDSTCEPNESFCMIDRNDEHFLYFRLDNLRKSTLPAINKLMRDQMSLEPHSQPILMFWRLLGLSGTFPAPNVDCCDPGVEFTPLNQYVAKFKRTSPAPVILEGTSDGNLLEVTLNFPASFSGTAVLAGSHVGFQFDEQSPSGTIVAGYPRLTIKQAGKVWFDGDIECVVSTYVQAAVRQPRAMSPLRYANMILEEK